MSEARSSDALLDEYVAARTKIDDAVAHVSARRASDLACRVGCSSCCVDGLTVLAVEAHAIVHHLEHEGLARIPAPPPGGCAFLDDGGACTIYEARPFLCRTHGLPLRAPKSEGTPTARTLTVVDDVSWCALNFTARPPEEKDMLDAVRVQALLTTVDARFRAASGARDERVALSTLCALALEHVSVESVDDDG